MDDEYQNMNTKEFRDRLLLNIFGVDDTEDVKEYVLTDEELGKLMSLRQNIQQTGHGTTASHQTLT